MKKVFRLKNKTDLEDFCRKQCGQVAQKHELRKGYIYVISCHEFTKIGIAKNLKARFSSLSTGNPYKIKLCASIKSLDVNGDEKKMHMMLKRFRTRGEWFKMRSKDVLKVLRSGGFRFSSAWPNPV